LQEKTALWLFGTVLISMFFKKMDVNLIMAVPTKLAADKISNILVCDIHAFTVCHWYRPV